MTPEEVLTWLEERRASCVRISNLAGCDDVEEWLSDARYFSAAIDLIKENLPDTHCGKQQ